MNARELRNLNLQGSEFPFYAEISSEMEIRTGRVGVRLPHPSKREHLPNDEAYEEDAPGVDFFVSKSGFRFYSSTEVSELNEDELTFRGYRQYNYHQYTYLRIKL